MSELNDGSPQTTPDPLPPPIPPAHDSADVTRTEPPEQSAPVDVRHPHYSPMEDLRIPRMTDALLKRPWALVYEIQEGRNLRATCFLLLIACLTIAIYGFVMGTFAGGNQLWALPLKISAGLLFCMAMCLPSLYILTADRKACGVDLQ